MPFKMLMLHMLERLMNLCGNIWEHFESLCAKREPAVLHLLEYMMITEDGAIDESSEGYYNAVQKRVSSTIERTFSIFKGEWRCLLAARTLHYSPEMASRICRITIECSILYNIWMPAAADNITSESNMQTGAVADFRVFSAAK